MSTGLAPKFPLCVCFQILSAQFYWGWRSEGELGGVPFHPLSGSPWPLGGVFGEEGPGHFSDA